MGPCWGERPWLGGKRAEQECKHPVTGKKVFSRLLVRHASNAYFPQVLSVISIPDANQGLDEAVGKLHKKYLSRVKGPEQLGMLREMMPEVEHRLAKFDDDDVWQAIQRFRDPKMAAKGSHKIKPAEIKTLLSSEQEMGTDQPDGIFFARSRPQESLDERFAGVVERIVLVHRLREVMAQVGFTRFESSMPDIDGELELEVRRAALSFDPDWVPALETRGEGVFIAFKPEVIESWLEREAVMKRGLRLEAGFKAWTKANEHQKKATFPGLPYIMLHTLSHLMITAISLECGYGASSIRERVYACDEGYGILLYTGTPGAEGTLGGLVEVGRRLEHHLAVALESGRLCSNDPVCAQHKPDQQHEERFLHGAACHGCVLIAETSCERRNEFLDRALVVPTVEALGSEFFGD